MAIIISQNGKNATKINKMQIDKEDYLQNYIYENPDAIPLYEIDEDIRLFVTAREFPTESGPIDALAFDEFGNIYLVETKLYKNPDKRTVVAQVIDYGSSLWQHSSDPVEFHLLLDRFTQKYHRSSFLDSIQSFFDKPDFNQEVFMENIFNNLQEGSFRFVVLMDQLEDRLKDLIVFLNQKSKFDIYAVELEYYQHETLEILIPKVFGAEVKKDIVCKKSANTFVSDDEFIDLYRSVNQEQQIREIVDVHTAIKNQTIIYDGWSAERSPKNISFTYKSPNRDKMSLVLSLTFNQEASEGVLGFWLYEKEIEEKVLSVISNTLEIPTTPLATDAKYGVVGKWPVKDFSPIQLHTIFSSIS